MTDQEFNHDALVGKTNTLLKDCPRSKKISDEALQVVERTNALLDESNRLKDQWYESKDSIESAKQMGITAQVVLCAALLSRRVKC